MVLRFTLLERFLHRLHLLPTPIMDAFAGVLFGRVLAIAVRRGLFDALASGPMNEEQIAGVTRLEPRVLHLLLEACVAAEYLDRGEGAYRLTTEGRKWFCKDSPHALVDFVAYVEMLHAHWMDLETSLEHGAPVRPYYEAYGEKEWRIYILGMRDLARVLLPQMIEKIVPPPGPRSLLDLGGSHGLYAIECCKRSPALHATIMDFAPALAHAPAFAREAGVAERVHVQAGNLLIDPLPGNQDVVLLFNIIHVFTGEQNRALVSRALAALRPGGKLFIMDQMSRQDGHSSPLARFVPAMVGINLLNEVGGSTYAVDKVAGWCGGRHVRELRLRMPGVVLLEVTS